MIATNRSRLLEGVTRLGNNGFGPIRNPGQHSPLLMQNRIIAEVWGPDGTLKQRIDHTGNIMATYGLNRLSEMLVSDAGGGSLFVRAAAIGTDSTAANSTQNSLGNSTQLVSGASLVRSDAGARTTQYNLTFASDGNAAAIHEVGLFETNQATASMVARSVLGTASINRGSADEIRVSYQIICGTA